MGGKEFLGRNKEWSGARKNVSHLICFLHAWTKVNIMCYEGRRDIPITVAENIGSRPLLNLDMANSYYRG